MTLAPALSADLLARFRSIVGDKHAVTDGNEKAPYLVEERGLYQGNSALILRPGTTDEVTAICKLASETRTPLVPQGGNTGLVGGQIPHHGEIVVSLRRLDKVREVDASSNTMTCEAGVILANAHVAAEKVDRIFPLWLGSEGSCTIGGNLATNAGGIAALSYGVARDLVLGLEVVLADGRILHGLSKLKKDNTGYDLRNLFIGAEGTLGIITAATLKLLPKPRTVETAFVGLASPEAALKLLELSQASSGSALTSFELLPDIAVQFALKHSPGLRAPLSSAHRWYVLMEISSPRDDARALIEGALEAAMEAGLVDDAAIASSLDQRKAFWTLREVISPAQKPEGGSIKHDVSVPVAAVPQFIIDADAAVAKVIPGARPVAFGHLGDGNIHYNVSQPVGADKAAYLARWHEVNNAVHAIVLKHGGSISAEHGIGVLKRDELPHVKDPVALDLMRTLKRTLDPLNILNPGKVV
jgi:FAD/FMN-containing dehydrogenase